MGYGGDYQVLTRIAVFGITMSVVCTAMIAVIFAADANGDYDFDTIQEYREELSQFTGESMLNQTPWVLSAVYTPWFFEDGLENHITDDNWLYGEAITSSEADPDDPDALYYPYIGKSSRIKLDPEQKSSVLLSVGDDTYDYIYENGLQWWAQQYGVPEFIALGPVGWLAHHGIIDLADALGVDTHTYDTKSVGTWNYTGYRYVFDPTLPFADAETKSVKDGALSIVWYTFNGQEGLSGALDVYGGDVLLGSYSATDIISAYNTNSGYAVHYDFDFQGTQLELYIQFDEDVIQSGVPLIQAWTDGQWSMAISSETVGNFLDIDGSTSYSVTGGSMVRTFIQIYTLSLPNINNDWMNIVLWLLVGLPMTLSLALITLRVMEAVKII